jgi:hypothetical protein
MTATSAERPSARKAKEKENRQPDFVVRAKTGPGGKDWSTIGYGWNRDRGEGLSVKLHSLPIGDDWKGNLKLLPPYVEDDGDDAAPE